MAFFGNRNTTISTARTVPMVLFLLTGQNSGINKFIILSENFIKMV